MKPTPTRVSLGIALALVLALGAVYAVRAWQARPDTELEAALAMAPSDTARYSWTDWAGVRDELGVSTDADSSGEEVEDLLDQGFDADLTSTSALVDSAVDLQERFGFSPASARWELFSQADEGMSVVVALDPDDLDGVEAGMRDLGYAEPADEDGVWDRTDSGDPTAATLTPELLYVTLDRDRGLLIGSDTSDRVELARSAVNGESAGVDPEVEEVAATLDAPLTALLSTGDQVCSALAMGQAAPADVERGQTLLDAAGEVDPITGFGIGGRRGGTVEVVMTFATEDQARVNAVTRAALAAGDAPGQGGRFDERFELGDVVADGTEVTMELRPVEGAYVLSDLSAGPVLFLTC